MIVRVIIILVITAISFIPSLQNNFTNWDDPHYLLENEEIRQFTLKDLAHQFKTIRSANYHPLTMISYMIEYRFFKYNPFIYHFTNYIFHLANTLLVFLLMRRLCTGWIIATVMSLFFGIHPLHVESVAWISERKDVLYAFFYLLALLHYVKYIKLPNCQPDSYRVPIANPIAIGCRLPIANYFFSLLFFLFSLLSKPAALVFPIVLVAIDYLLNSQVNKRSVLEKVPFLVLSLIFGIVTLNAQETAIASFTTFTIPQRFMFACYGICAYIFKFFVPIQQCCFYPYPYLIEGTRLPYLFYICPVIVLALIVLIGFLYKFSRSVVFGFLFFLVNVALVLQFVSVGNNLMAERYTYISYIGLLFIAASGFEKLYFHKKTVFRHTGKACAVLLGCAAVACSYLTYERCKVWKNSETLWSDCAEKFPTYSDGYVMRTSHYLKTNQYDKAMKDLNLILQIDPGYWTMYLNRGNIYAMNNNVKEALADYNAAIKYKSDYLDAYLNRAITYARMNVNDSAIADFSKAIELSPENKQTYIHRAYLYLNTGQYSKAISDYDIAIKHFPTDQNLYLNRGLAHYYAEKFEMAFNDFTNCIQYKPDNAAAYKNRALVLYALGKHRQALEDVLKAQELGDTAR